jgi:hypothetical protein
LQLRQSEVDNKRLSGLIKDVTQLIADARVPNGS